MSLLIIPNPLLVSVAVQETRQLTRENVERKQSRTAAELEDEEEEAAENLYSSAEEEEADDDIIYNPKDVPLGWDGKVCGCCAHGLL